MGYNTAIIVLNDALDMIRDDPTFGKNLHDAVIGRERDPRGNRLIRDIPAYSSKGGVFCNAASVIESHHADGTTVIAVGGNYGTVLHETYGWKHHETDQQERLVREMADKLGYRLVKKASKAA